MQPETVPQFAARRNVSRRTVIDWIARGHVQARRKGYGPTSPWEIFAATPVISQKIKPAPVRRHGAAAAQVQQDEANRQALEDYYRQRDQPSTIPASKNERPGSPAGRSGSEPQRAVNETRYVTDPEIDQEPPRGILELSDDDIRDYFNRKLTDW